MNNDTLKIGSKLVEAGEVFVVFKIEEIKGKEGLERIVHYKPCYTKPASESIVCSIPEKNLTSSNIRRPLSKKSLKELISKLCVSEDDDNTLEVEEAKISLQSNDINKAAATLRKLWRESIKAKEELPKLRRDLIVLAINKMVEEVAVVNSISPDRARERIVKALG